MLPPTSHTLSQLGRFPDVAAALAGSPPDPLEPIMPEFEQTPEGRFAVLPNGDRDPAGRSRRRPERAEARNRIGSGASGVQ